MEQPRYWVVGAMYGGTDDQFDTFISEGRWALGWERSEQPAQQALLDQVRTGDRVAIKRMLGQGSPNIEVRALGVVTAIHPDDRSITVQWAVSDLRRAVPAKGCFRSIHGPFPQDDAWTRQVFQL